jgi:hypothetical protein
MRATRPLMLALALCAALSAQAAAQDEPKEAVLKDVQDPQLRSFRTVTAGLDTFEKFHAMAPAVATLHFRLRPREQAAGTVTLSIVGQGAPIPVPIDAEGSFALRRNQAAYDENAELIFSPMRDYSASVADIRTPGVPANARRLGDLRLECKVNLAVIKKEIPFLAKAVVNTFLLTSDWCSKMPMFLSLPSDKKIRKATLVFGDRRRELTRDEVVNGYKSPLLDPAWPDDSLLELDVDENPAPAAGV